MNRLIVFCGIYIISVFVSSVSQVLLKSSTKKKHKTLWSEYLDPLVVSAYAMFVGCTIITMYALKVVPLSMAPVMEASGYIFVAALSRIFLKEKVSKKKTVGLGIIVVGILIYAI